MRSFHHANWLCFACRRAVRRTTESTGVTCPTCGGSCTWLGHQHAIPPKRDVTAWAALEERVRAKAVARAADRFAGRVRRRHALEQEIRRIEARPQSEGRDGLLRTLRKKLAAL